MKVVIEIDTSSPENLKKLMKGHGTSKCAYSGKNQDGENVLVSINDDSICVATMQSNGWTRKNYFDSDGYPCGETFMK